MKVRILIVMALALATLASCAARKSQVQNDVQMDMQHTELEERKQVDNSWLDEVVKSTRSIIDRDSYTTTTTETLYSAPDSTGAQYKVAERKQITESSGERKMVAKEEKELEAQESTLNEELKSNQLIDKSEVATKEVVQTKTKSPVALYLIGGVLLAIGIYWVWRKVKRYIL